MGVADHVLESISGHLSRRMLEHYSHIRIDAKRQALDALDDAAARQRTTGTATGDGARPAKSRRSWRSPPTSRHSHVTVCFCSGSPPSGKLLIPLNRRDVRVVEGARLESEARQRHEATPTSLNAYAISELALQNDSSVCVCKPRCSSWF